MIFCCLSRLRRLMNLPPVWIFTPFVSLEINSKHSLCTLYRNQKKSQTSVRYYLTKEHLFDNILKEQMFREGFCMKRKYILKNKRRFSVFIIFLVLLIVSTGYIVNAGTVQTKTSYDVVRIEKGDTLWEIASLYAENSDPRAYIYEIKKLNKLDGDLIFEGQELYLP
ncbi:MAG TPA: hypothetical protein DD738_12195 [Ruminiclostridium sp.]|nr:hypothetical protein [Ruminiclostridium sp.]